MFLTSPQELTYFETKYEAAVSPGKTTLCLPCPALHFRGCSGPPLSTVSADMSILSG